MKLPDLPPPTYEAGLNFRNGWYTQQDEPTFTADQLRAYGLTCAEWMRERCAKECERIYDDGLSGAHGGEQCNRTAAAIRSLPIDKE